MSLEQPLDFTSTLDTLALLLPEKLQKPRVGIVCGSGLSGLADVLRESVVIPYDRIPGFGVSTAPGHKSALAFGLLGGGDGIPVVAMLGRFHRYEGYEFSTIMYPIRVMARLGVKHVIITNAAGSLRPSIPVGTIVVIHDHLGIPALTGFNPLLGPKTSSSYPRFLPLSDAYSRDLRRLVFLAAHQLKLEKSALAEGTYAWVSGPTYETPADGRFLRDAGGDVVGMSTIPEVLAAREEGLNVLAFSLVSNLVTIPDKYNSVAEEVEAELSGRKFEVPEEHVISHAEVLEVGRQKADLMRKLVEKVIEMIPA